MQTLEIAIAEWVCLRYDRGASTILADGSSALLHSLGPL